MPAWRKVLGGAEAETAQQCSAGPPGARVWGEALSWLPTSLRACKSTLTLVKTAHLLIETFTVKIINLPLGPDGALGEAGATLWVLYTDW